MIDWKLRTKLNHFLTNGPPAYDLLTKEFDMTSDTLNRIVDKEYFPDLDTAYRMVEFIDDNNLTVRFSRFERV